MGLTKADAQNTSLDPDSQNTQQATLPQKAVDTETRKTKRLRKKAEYIAKQALATIQAKAEIPALIIPDKVPPKLDLNITDIILGNIVNGMSLRAICRYPAMPCITTVMRWLRENPNFLAQYTVAREEQTEANVDRILEIADDPNLLAEDKRVMIDARKWIAGKIKGKKYGDKIQADIMLTAIKQLVIE